MSNLSNRSVLSLALFSLFSSWFSLGVSSWSDSTLSILWERSFLSSAFVWQREKRIVTAAAFFRHHSMQKENEHRTALKEWIRWMGDTCTDLGGIKDAYDSGKEELKLEFACQDPYQPQFVKLLNHLILIVKPLYYSTV